MEREDHGVSGGKDRHVLTHFEMKRCLGTDLNARRVLAGVVHWFIVCRSS
jgi:hypothetical protein